MEFTIINKHHQIIINKQIKDAEKYYKQQMTVNCQIAIFIRSGMVYGERGERNN